MNHHWDKIGMNGGYHLPSGKIECFLIISDKY